MHTLLISLNYAQVNYLDVFEVEPAELFEVRLLAITSPCFIKPPLGLIEKDLNLKSKEKSLLPCII